MENEQGTLKEINQRVTRVESRIVHLGDRLGVNLRSRQINVICDDRGPRVEVDAPDISISTIINKLRDSGVKKGDPAYITWNGDLIAVVFA